MSPELLLFAVGGLLLITGLVGGGFEMRELKIPRVGRFARVLAAGAGGACIMLGIGLATVEPEAVGKSPATFRIRDELGPNQLSEQVTVVVDGRRVGDLTVNENYPTSELEVTVEEPGRHDYTVSVSSLELAEDGTVVERDGTGQGSIVVEEGAAFQIAYSESGDERNVTLMAETS